MPIFEYVCPEGHRTERIRKYADRDLQTLCHLGHEADRVEISAPHIVPDGVYSYAPNVGDPAAFERRLEDNKNGVKIRRKEMPVER